ncbi:ABC-three component system protein [Streptomyces tanashiensis]|uniref:ABC-three component system protein n=1 Tax=Streptomyces tanashiensis TaxID=67367 RepID=UPI001E537F8E|nr:ABC-three component system protein [Streptomyces tanashiensis]
MSGVQGETLDPSQGLQAVVGQAGPPSLILNYPTAMQFPAMPSPEKIVFGYDPNEFEKFVEEWVPALDDLYVQVVRQGGAGDHGIDVAAFLTPQGLEGPWHNYQCKRYKGTLAWSTAAGEIRKMLAGVVTGEFTVPERYVFVAPSIGPSLHQALQRPVSTRKNFMEALRETTDKVITDLGPRLRREVEELAADTPFEIFQTVNMKQMLEQHKTTDFWVKRFPPESPPRPAVMEPPEQPEPREARYVQQLIQVYTERWPSAATTVPQAAQHPTAGPHLRHQREAFFSAESLRRFGEEAYPPGHFEAIVKDIYDAVINVARDDHPTGWRRLQAVTSQAISAGLTQTIFAQHVRPLDRTGVCHHLANEDELTWCEGEGT